MLSAALSRLSLSSRPRLFALLSALSPAAGSWRRCGRFLAVSWGKRCVCVLSCSGSFSASRVMWRIASGDGFPYRADGVGGSSCLLFIGSRVPLPLGAGDYVRPAGFGLVCGEGVGVFSRFSYFSACRRVISSSLVVIALGLLASLPSSSSPHAALPCSSRSCVSPRLCVSLSYRSSPRSFDEPDGAFFACLSRSLRFSSSRLVFLFSCPRACLPHGDRSCCPRSRSSSSASSLVSCCPPVCLFSPFFDKRGRGACGGSFFACLPLSFSAAVPLSCVRAGCHRRRMACGWGVGVAPCLPWDGGGRCGVGCGCVRFVVGVFVYMNLVLARVS